MKIIALILSLLFCPEIKAQNVTDVYLKTQKKNGLVNARNQYLRLQNLINDYLANTGKNLQKSSRLYFLEENAIAPNSSIVIIWNETDTIFNRIDLLSRYNNTNYATAKPLNFENILNIEKDRFLSIMDFVSTTNAVDLASEIKKKTIPEGTYLDGSLYTLYIFNKKGRNYRADNYFFTDLAL